MTHCAIVVPCRDRLAHTSWQALTAIYSYSAGLWAERGDVVSMHNVSQAHVVSARNKLSEIALEGGWDWILWMDDDAAPLDGNGEPILDLIDRLMAHGKKWVVPLFFQRGYPFKCTVGDFLPSGDGKLQVKPIKIDPMRLEKVDSAGFHTMLMHKSVLLDTRNSLPVDRDLFRYEGGVGEDVQFCKDAAAAGHQLWCDTSLDVGHVAEMVIDRRIHVLAQSQYGHLLNTGG